MGKLTLDDLRKLREAKKSELSRRNNEDHSTQVIIGMGTCGIAAGAKVTLASFVKELDAKGLTSVVVKQTGCLGACDVEPTVEIIVPGMPTVVYGKVDGDTAKEIIEKHIIGKELLDNHIQDKPAIDIIET